MSIRRTERWYSPALEDLSSQPGLPPTVPAFDPALIADLLGNSDPQFQRELAAWATVDDVGGQLLIPGLTVASVDQQAGLWSHDVQQDRSTGRSWVAPEGPTEGPLPPAVTFDPAPYADLFGDARWQAVAATWAVDPCDSSWVPIPNLTVASVDQQAPLWQEQPAAWSSRLGHQPLEATESPFPPGAVVPPTTEQLAGLFGMEQALPITTPWQLAADTLGIDTTPSFDPSLLDWGWDGRLDLSRGVRWFAPEAMFDGFVPIPGVPAFDPATVAGFLGDGQLDRSVQPVWRHDPDDSLPIFPSLPVYVPPTVPQLAELWLEQPGQERANTQRWYHPANDPVDGPLQSWLFITWGGGGGGGATPAVLINAEDGEVFLSIGGNFIVPAS